MFKFLKRKKNNRIDKDSVIRQFEEVVRKTVRSRALTHSEISKLRRNLRTTNYTNQELERISDLLYTINSNDIINKDVASFLNEYINLETKATDNKNKTPYSNKVDNLQYEITDLQLKIKAHKASRDKALENNNKSAFQISNNNLKRAEFSIGQKEKSLVQILKSLETKEQRDAILESGSLSTELINEILEVDMTEVTDAALETREFDQKNEELQSEMSELAAETYGITDLEDDFEAAREEYLMNKNIEDKIQKENKISKIKDVE